MLNATSVIQTAKHLVGDAFAAEMEEMVDCAQKALTRLHSAATFGSIRWIKTTQQQVFRSFAVRLCCVVLSVEKTDEAITSGFLRQVAGELDAFADPDEPVRAYAKVKSNRGDWRPICAFGPRRKALQTLVNLVLIAKFGPHPLDFMAHGRGSEIAADRITQLIDGGIDHFVVADIEACFRSVKQGKVAELLGLPPAVVRHCLLIGEDVPLILPSALPLDTSPQAFSEAVRQGLPQGARSSNRVVSQLLGPELGSLTSDSRIILYGDDIAVPAATRLEADTFAKTLPERLGAHPAGPFRLKRCEVAEAQVGFNFLKYKVRRDRFTGAAQLRPSDLSYHRFHERVREIVRLEALDEVYPAVMAYRDHWLTSFRRYEANPTALNLLGLLSIGHLPGHLLKKWDFSCQTYAKSGQPVLHHVDDWLDLGVA